MRFRWSQQSIAWFLDASEYTRFHKQLAKLIIPYLNQEDTVCDFGCGLGRLDLKLSPFVFCITAVDVDSKVIDILAQNIKDLEIKNIHPFCGDSKCIDRPCDVGIMSFFGKSGQDMLFYKRLCRKKLIRIVNAENQSTLYPQSYRRTQKDTVPIVKSELLSKGMNFDLIEASIEFGQPLRSQNCAERFILSHAPQATIQEIQTFLAEHAVLTGRDDFPIYIPNRKQLGIFIID